MKSSACRLLVFLAITSFLGATAQAAVFNVTKTADTADGACDADCSLREAIIAANAAGGADSVIVPAGTYVLSRVGPEVEDFNFGTAAVRDLDLIGSITIQGDGPGQTIIDANGIDRVFDINFGSAFFSTMTFDGLTIRGGSTGGISATQQLIGMRMNHHAHS